MKLEDYKGDKRTKAYRDFKAKFEQENKGLGDNLKDALELTGIAAIVHKVVGEDCGCKERQEVLNHFGYKLAEVFRGRRNPLLLTEEEFEYLDYVFNTPDKIVPEIQEKLKIIYARVFRKNIISSCLSCGFLVEIYNPLQKLYKTYTTK